MRRFGILFILLTTLVFFACEDPNMKDIEQNVDQEATLSSGDWNILFFFNESGDQAREFANYNFYFDKGGVINAVKSENISGTWSIGEVSNKSKRLVINFSNPKFQCLAKEWIIQEMTNEKIELSRYSSEGSENLVFTR